MEDNNIMTPIPRKVFRNTNTNRYSLDRPETSEIESKVNQETWPNRYHHIVSQAGLRTTARQLIKTTNVVDWIDLSKQNGAPVLFMDGKFIFFAVNRQGLFADMKVMGNMPWLHAKPYYYFQYHEQGSEKVNKLLGLLQREEFKLTMKPFKDVRQGEAFGFADSLIPQLMVDMIEAVIDEEPVINHVLLFTTNEAVIPAVNYIRKLDVKVTIGITKNQPVSNYFLSQFDYIVEAIDLLDYSGVTKSFDTER